MPNPANINIGSRVRSYDFDGRKDCYVEGTLVGYKWVEGCNRYVINVDKHVLEGEDETAMITRRFTVYPPVNGTRKLFGIGGNVCDGVEVISPPALGE